MTTSLEGVPGNHHQQVVAVQLVSLPMRMGRLGLRSASKIAPAAYWASWADALPMIQGRVPQIAGLVVQLLDQDATGCLGELQQATATLDWSGFVGTPNWRSLSAGARPLPVAQAEPGEWQHGWQYFASSSLELDFRETVVLVQLSAADQAHLRSHSGPGANEVLGTAPTKPEFTVEAAVFRTLILERLRLQLGIMDARCQCGGHLDSTGRRRAACPRSGGLRSRAGAPERTLARVFREAGAVLRRNVKLRDMDTTVLVSDERQIEVLAAGLPIHMALSSRLTSHSGVRSQHVAELVRGRRHPMEQCHSEHAQTKRTSILSSSKVGAVISWWCQLRLEVDGRGGSEIHPQLGFR